jgi:hypothetical protein
MKNHQISSAAADPWAVVYRMTGGDKVHVLFSSREIAEKVAGNHIDLFVMMADEVEALDSTPVVDGVFSDLDNYMESVTAEIGRLRTQTCQIEAETRQLQAETRRLKREIRSQRQRSRQFLADMLAATSARLAAMRNDRRELLAMRLEDRASVISAEWPEFDALTGACIAYADSWITYCHGVRELILQGRDTVPVRWVEVEAAVVRLNNSTLQPPKLPQLVKKMRDDDRHD